MESRIIYESDKTYLNRIRWIKPKNDSESEWYYLNPKSLTEIDIEKNFKNSFVGETFYLAINRNDSTEVNRINLYSRIKSLYGEIEFRIWDINFENVVEFKLEIYRKGTNVLLRL